MELRDAIEREAHAAARALASLADAPVAEALREAGGLLRRRGLHVLGANAADVDAAAGRLNAGMLDRLRLDDGRIAALADQLEAMAELPPLERETASWTLPNGLRVSERRIPIGVVGATFEARPNVALDIAAQLLKSLNAGLLRTGGAALRTVTALVDDVLRPALEHAGLPPDAVGLVRSPDRDGASLLVSLPHVVPLVIVRGSGATTATLARAGAEHGVRVLAHAEGGGVLYVDRSADRERLRALVAASLDRLGVCNRLNVVLVDGAATNLLADVMSACKDAGVTPRGTERVQRHADIPPLEVPLRHEWANDEAHVATVSIDLVDGVDEAARIASDETSGLAAGVVAEDARAAERFLDRYRGTVAFWHASTRFADGFELTRAPETGINVDWFPGPRGPVTYRDLWLRQYRVIGDATQHR